MDEHVEAYLDGDLPLPDATRFEHGLAGEDWAEAVDLARQIQAGLQAQPQLFCPPHVTQTVLREVRRRARASWIQRLQARAEARWRAMWQPALAMAVLVTLVVSAALVGRTPPAPGYEQAEVAVALEDVKWTLAYLSEVGRQTGRSVRRDVLEPHVVEPMQRAVGIVMDHRPNE